MNGDWRDRAACRDYDPETWFPTKTESDAGWEAAAKRVCRDKCWVQAECLTFALDMNATGIWAGMTKTERDRIKRHAHRGDHR